MPIPVALRRPQHKIFVVVSIVVSVAVIVTVHASPISVLKNQAVDEAIKRALFALPSPPAEGPRKMIFLLSGDKDYIEAIKRIQALGYVVICASQKDGCSRKLFNLVSRTWLGKSLYEGGGPWEGNPEWPELKPKKVKKLNKEIKTQNRLKARKKQLEEQHEEQTYFDNDMFSSGE